ncbi:MAG: redoxin family protein [Planctomycetota bacterium]
MPTTGDLVRLQKKYENKPVTIIAVYSARSKEAAFHKHVKAKRLSYPAIYDCDDRISKAYGLTRDGLRYPVTPTFLIGRDGKVLWEKTRLYHWPKSIGVLEQMIDKELASRSARF